MVAIFENESYYTCPVAKFLCVYFRGKSFGIKSNIKTENDDAICATTLRPEMCRLIFLTKSTTSLTRPEFSQQSYNSHSLSTEIQIEVKTEVKPEVESEVDSKIEPQVKLEVELKVESDVKLEIESDVKLEDDAEIELKVESEVES